jgi:photosystem II stability/assembly factor-like uncharacterized protein
MIINTRKIFLSMLLLFIVFSFSGCLGITLPGNSTGSSVTSTGRNDSQGIFKTTDGGKTWTQKVTIEGSQTKLSQDTIGSMAIDPDNTKILYLGTLNDGIYKTENGGDSWHKISDQNNKLKTNSSIYDIAVENGNSSIIYAASLNGNRGVLLKSIDAGKTWDEKYISTESGKQINRVQIDPQQKNIVYIGTEQGGFIKSRDRGENWEDIKWFSTGVKDFVVDYKNTKGIIILTHHGLFKAVDGGTENDNSWKILTPTIINSVNIPSDKINGITSITIDNQNPLVVYMTYSNVIYITRDGGLTWGKLKTITPTVTTSQKTPVIKKVAMLGNMIYYGAGNAIYKSNDRGLTWSSFDIPLLGDVKYAVSDPKDSNTIYVGSSVN